MYPVLIRVKKLTSSSNEESYSKIYQEIQLITFAFFSFKLIFIDKSMYSGYLCKDVKNVLLNTDLVVNAFVKIQAGPCWNMYVRNYFFEFLQIVHIYLTLNSSLLSEQSQVCIVKKENKSRETNWPLCQSNF